MTRSVLLFVTAAMVAYCGSQPSAASDSMRDATRDVATRAATDGGQRARESGSIPPSRMFVGADDTAEIQLNQGRKPYDQIAYARAIRAGRNAMAGWPTGPTALSGAILPHSRIVAYYGNPHSKKMGVLGEYPEQQMLSMLDETVAMWRKADASTPVIPAIHLVTVVAQ